MLVPRDRTGHVLALDLAGTVGWCGGAFGARPRYGAIFLRGDAAEDRGAALRDWLDDYEKVAGRVTALVVEAAILTQRDTASLVELLFGLRVVAKLWAYDGEIPPQARISISSDKVRAHMLGTARFPKGTVKQHVLAWCRHHGFDTASDDAADAILTWHYAEAIVSGRPAAPRPGLLSAA